mmetsp:Transcript_9081/g.23548  ORF Transcript_9081/g.23548 Transcript_9081/m.23548 type:complete len:249 (-) Transcript_9081:92-838(-)
MPPRRGLQKSQSATELRKQILANDPFWKNIKDLSGDDKKTLEGSWNGRHNIHFSVMNKGLPVQQRDYFDRPRDYSDPAKYSCLPTRWQPSWSLSHIDDEERNPFSSTSLSKASAGPKAVVAASRSSSSGSRRKPAWNDRHHVTLSEANGTYHDSQKEYFGRYVQSRADTVVPQRVHGLTMHNFPFAHPADPNGCDSEPSLAEKVMTTSSRPGHGALGLEPDVPMTAPSKFGPRSTGGFAAKADPRATV